MKTLIASASCLGAVSLLCSCTTVVEKEPSFQTTSTTTEQSTTTRPSYNTTETKTIQTY